MGIPRDLDLPWPPDRLGSGAIYDLNDTSDGQVREKSPLGFATHSANPVGEIRRNRARLASCSIEAPCGWCPDCVMGSDNS